MSGYAITNSSYPGWCGDTISIPLTTDVSRPLSAGLGAALQPSTPLNFVFDEAIQAADRHVYVEGTPPNSLAFVEDWINLLRWEISNLWTIDTVNSRYTRNRSIPLTHEHYKRSGEILAEGIAILLLERRLGIPRQRIFFYNGADARPDFVAHLKPRHNRALVYRGHKLALEVRSRKSQVGLNASDIVSLDKKKDGFAGVLAVYCFYGEHQHRDATSHTRIHLADPSGDDIAEVSDLEKSEIVIHHYLRITSQLGLWEHRDHLLAAAEAASSGIVYHDRMEQRVAPRISRGITRRKKGREFLGREFNTLLEYAHTKPSSLEQKKEIRREAQLRIQLRDFGTTIFRGLAFDVVRLIETSDWEALFNWNGFDANQESETDFVVNDWARSDGLCRDQLRVEPDSQAADDVKTQLRLILEE